MCRRKPAKGTTYFLLQFKKSRLQKFTSVGRLPSLVSSDHLPVCDLFIYLLNSKTSEFPRHWKRKEKNQKKRRKENAVSLPFPPIFLMRTGRAGRDRPGSRGARESIYSAIAGLELVLDLLLSLPLLRVLSSPSSSSLHLCCSCSSARIGGFFGDIQGRSNLRFSVVFRIFFPPPRYSYLSSELLIIFLLSEIPSCFPPISSFQTCCASVAVCSGDVRGCFPSFLDSVSIVFQQFSIIFLRSEVPPLFPPISSFQGSALVHFVFLLTLQLELPLSFEAISAIQRVICCCCGCRVELTFFDLDLELFKTWYVFSLGLVLM